MKKSFIEADFPIKEVSEQSVREKNIRHGHISTLHIWWARRPLAASRASILAALVPDPENEKERKELKNLIAEISKWENSNNKKLLEKARSLIKKAYPDGPPKVLDCFAGGGSIPLEALRLGCETYALDLNPVAVLILKATLEYPQKYGQPQKIKVKNESGMFEEKEINPLVEDVKKWGNWVLEETRKELARFYPNDPDGSIPVGYIWARTIRCQNPSCGTEIPLMRQFWLCNKENKKIALKLLVDKKNKKIDFKIVKDKEIDFDPSRGTTARATVQCPVCNSGIDDNTTRRLFQEKKSSERMVVVVLHKPGIQGKTYRIANEKDFEVFKEAEKYLQKKRQELFEKWNFDPVPDEPMNQDDPTTVAGRGYGFKTWGDLFNSRQKLALIILIEKVKNLSREFRDISKTIKWNKQLLTYLGLGIDKISDRNSSLCRWIPQTQAIGYTFGRQALPMVWDYFEMNIFEHEGGWEEIINSLAEVIDHCSFRPEVLAISSHGDATALNYPSGNFDGVFTDPPYYDNINYSELSDFFYVWLKRSCGNIYPEFFSTPLTPKTQEIVQNPIRHKNQEEAKKFFETMLTQSFKEIYRVLKPDGIAVIVFAHKSTDAWETIINSILNSGLILTSSWPVHTERVGRMISYETASLASSIYMVCRKRTKEETAYFNEIKPQIDQRIKEKLTQFWNEGISGSDFFISAIGPAVEVFGKYTKVLRLSGEEVSVKELLEYVRKVVSEFALERILKHVELGEVDNETRFYLLWRWTYNSAKVHFDDARKLAQAVGLELTEHWDRGGFIKKEKEFVYCLGPQERVKDSYFMKGLESRYIGTADEQQTLFSDVMPVVKTVKPMSMIDVLHYAVLLWEKGRKKEIKELLNQTGFARNEIFYQTAQAISEVLPKGDKEKQLLQGFLYSKEEYKK